MMRRAVRRGMSLLLALCLVLGLAPAAFAADATNAAKEVIRTANDHNNFDYDQYANGTIQLNASAAGGTVRYTFQRPADAKAGSLYAAVLPTDANGNPGGYTWQDVRYVRLSESGSMSYFRQGCRHFAVMLVQPLPDGGKAAVKITAIRKNDTAAATTDELDFHMVNDRDAKYELDVQATLTMSLDMAQLTDAAQSDPEMKNLTFTSHIRFNPALGSVAVNSLTLNSGIFQIASQAPAAGEAGVDVTCTLKPDWTKTEGWTSLVDKLQKEMTFTGTVTLTGAQIKALVDNGQSALYAVGWNTIGNIPDRVLGGSQVQVPAALLELPVAVTDDLVVDVVDQDGNPLSDAKVTLTLVTNSDGWERNDTTDSSGQVTFTDIPYGTYRVDVEYSHPDENGKDCEHHATHTGIFYTSGQKVTMVIRMNTKTEVNTKVETATDTDKAQSASAGNLENAMEVQEPEAGVEKQTVEIVLNVEKVTEASTPSTDPSQEPAPEEAAEEIVQEVGAQVVENPETAEKLPVDKPIITDFVDATITATTTTVKTDGTAPTSETEQIKNTAQLISVYIPVPDNLLALLARQGLTTDSILVYRHHTTADGSREIEALDRINSGNTADEGFYPVTLTDKGQTRDYVVIRAEKFSVYAFGVVLSDLPEPEPEEPDHGGSGGVTRYPVETESGGRGSASASHDRASAGTKVTVTVTPDEGYRLNNITVTDSAGNRITVTANADGTYTFTMPHRGVTVEVDFTLDIADPDDTGVSGWLETGEHMAYMIGDDHGDFRPDANITRAEVAQLFYRLLRNQDVPVTETFSDVEEDAWYAHAVNVLASLGMVNGVGGNQFAPERAITRAEFAAIAARFAHASESGVTFSDVPESHWAYNEISTAAAYGWVNGVGNGRFAPDRLITRGEAAAMVNRMLGRLADKAAIDAGQARPFPDVDDSHWAWYEIGEATTEHDYTMGTEMETWTVR